MVADPLTSLTSHPSTTTLNDLLTLAHTAYSSRDYTTAPSPCESIYTADAYRTGNLLLLCSVHFQLRNLSESIFYAQQAIRVDPMMAEAYSNLGNALREVRRVVGVLG